MDNIDCIVTYINGNLSLLIKRQDERLELRARENTAALLVEYKTNKSIVHASVAIHLVLGSIIRSQEKSRQDKKDLRKIARELKKLQDPKNALQEHATAISLMLDCIQKALALEDLKQLPCLKGQVLKAIEPVNFRYAANSADLQWDALQEIMNQWCLKYALSLEKTRILIASVKGPKKGLLEAQFFHHLYEKAGLLEKDLEDEESDYICRFEMLSEQLSALTDERLVYELKRKLLNAELALDLLDDPKGMDKDVLGPHANRRREEESKRSCPLSASRQTLFGKRVQEKGSVEEHSVRPCME